MCILLYLAKLREYLCIHTGHTPPFSSASALSFWPFPWSKFLRDLADPKKPPDAVNYPENSSLLFHVSLVLPILFHML